MSEGSKVNKKNGQIVVHAILIAVIIAGFTAGYIWIPVITIIIETIFWLVVAISVPFDND